MVYVGSMEVYVLIGLWRSMRGLCGVYGGICFDWSMEFHVWSMKVNMWSMEFHAWSMRVYVSPCAHC